VPARNLHAHIQKLCQIEYGDTETGMQIEFKVTLCFLKITFSLNFSFKS